MTTYAGGAEDSWERGKSESKEEQQQTKEEPANPYKSAGDATKHWQRHLNILNSASKTEPAAGAQDKIAQENTTVEHTTEEESEQALGKSEGVVPDMELEQKMEADVCEEKKVSYLVFSCIVLILE